MMRYALVLELLAANFIFQLGSAALTEVTGVTASANAWDTRVSGSGCPPSGCLPGNVLDGSTSPASRWSCSASLLSSSEVCELTLGFETPQEISQISMALHMGDERVRTFNVLVDGVLATTITSSGTTLEFEPYELIVSGATTVVLQAGMPANSWFSITEVAFFVDDGIPSSPTPGPTPDDNNGLTLVTGVTAFANAWDTRVDSSGCAPSGCVAENVLDGSLDPTSRWSCSESLSESGGSCELTLEFEDPQDIVQINMALHRGDQRTRSVDVWVDGDPVATLVSSGMTLDFEPYELIAPQASIIMLRATAVDDNGWLSITEIEFFSGEILPPSPTPVVIMPTPSGMPTPTTTSSTTDCADGSVPNSLDISLEFEGNLQSLKLLVLEPGGERPVGFQSSSGEVGTITGFSGDFQLTGPQSKTYLLLNGLSVGEDQVLGDYVVSVETSGGIYGAENIPYTLTARSNGITLWTLEGLSLPPFGVSDSYVATVTEYTESDCTLERYGECFYTFSPTGNPPCEECPEGLEAFRGDTYCTVQTLAFMGLPEVVSDAVLEDAVHGFPGFGRVNFDQDFSLPINLGEEDGGIVNASGNLDFTFEATDLPGSTGIFYYVYDVREDPVTGFMSGQGDLDTSTGDFSVAIPVLDGPSRVLIIFIITDASDATSTGFDAPMAALDVFSNECDESYLTITLETDVEGSYIDMGVFEPESGFWPVFDTGSVGYIDREQQYGLGPETYRLYNGLSVDKNSVLGAYRVRLFEEFIEVATPFTLTFRVAGEIVRVDEDVFPVDGNIIESLPFVIDDYVSFEGC